MYFHLLGTISAPATPSKHQNSKKWSNFDKILSVICFENLKFGPNDITAHSLLSNKSYLTKLIILNNMHCCPPLYEIRKTDLCFETNRNELQYAVTFTSWGRLVVSLPTFSMSMWSAITPSCQSHLKLLRRRGYGKICAVTRDIWGGWKSICFHYDKPLKAEHVSKFCLHVGILNSIPLQFHPYKVTTRAKRTPHCPAGCRRTALRQAWLEPCRTHPLPPAAPHL